MMKTKLSILFFSLLWVMQGFTQEQLIEVPEVTNNYTEREQLAYIQSDDDVNSMTYAYLAYKETDLNTGKWFIYIKGHKTAGAKLDPDHSAFKRKCNEAAKTDEKYFIHGFSMKARPADAREVEFRIHTDDSGMPIALELYLVTRNSDGSPKEAEKKQIEWPSS